MMMTNYNNKDKLHSLSKMYLTNKDIQIICDCGRNVATVIRKQFKEWCVLNQIEDIGKVRSDDFIKFLSIDIERIKYFAKEGY